MGLFNLKKSKKEKKLPLVARVDLAKIHKERTENYELRDVSILARKDYTESLKNKIRLCYVDVDLLNMYGFEKPVLEINYAATCVYKLPDGMTIEDANRVVSYVTRLNNSKYSIVPSTESSMQFAGASLQEFGFKKESKHEADYNHAHVFCEYDSELPDFTINTNNVVKTDIEGVVDLMTIGGNQFLFMHSDLAPKAYPWFRMDSKFEDVKKIYDRIGINLAKNGVVNARGKEQE